jgi:hypothetical protein
MKSGHATRSATDAPGASLAEPRSAGPAPRVEGEGALESQRVAGNRALTRRLSPAAAEADAGGRSGRGGAVLVEDDAAQVGPGQMRRGPFLAALRREVCTTADEGMAGTGRTSQGCPWIEFWFAHYADKSVAHLERAVRRFAPESAGTHDARDLVRVLAARVRRSVDRWARTGEIAGLPEGVPLDLPTGAGIAFFARPGGAALGADPGAVRERLGPGQPLEGELRARMESAFGQSFAHVRAHTDAGAAGLVGAMNASAFTVGEHVAFGQGAYRPGTLMGDALIAHELAHTLQQSAPGSPGGARATAGIEHEADLAAAGAIGALGHGRQAAVARPQPTGLRLQMSNCGGRRCDFRTRTPDVFQREFEGLRTAMITPLPAGSAREGVNQALGLEWAAYLIEETQAGNDADKLACAQRDLLARVEAVRATVAPLLRLARRYPSIQFTVGVTSVRREGRIVGNRIGAWTVEQLNDLDAILAGVPPEYLSRIRKIQREPGRSPRTPAAWRDSEATLLIYDTFFEASDSHFYKQRWLIHEIGHSTRADRSEGGFTQLPPQDWMDLVGWRRSTAATLAADLGVGQDEAQRRIAQLTELKRNREEERAQSRIQAGGRFPLTVGSWKLVYDKYEGNPQTPPTRFFFYPASRDDNFVTDYARTHPEEDFAESFAYYMVDPRDYPFQASAESVLDRPRGGPSKWTYMQRNFPRRRPSDPLPAPRP